MEFPCCSTVNDLSIHASFATVGLIMSKIDEAEVISALQHKAKFYFDLSWKENQIFGYPCCSTREVLSIDVSITTVGLILTKLW